LDVFSSHFARLAGATAGATLVGAVLVQSRALSGAPAGTPAQPARSTTQGIRFTTLPDFVIERINPVDKLDSYVVITFDSFGRIVVSKENDFPRLLLDNDKDGIYEAEKVITEKIRNCQGLWFDGRTLYGDCAPGETPPPPQPGASNSGGPNPTPRSALYKLEDTNGDDVLDTIETLNTYVGGIQEHGPHAIRRGPDGEMTVIIGNNTFMQDELVDRRTPITEFRESQLLPALPDGRGFGPSVKEGVHATISRFDREQKHFTLLVSGLRNAYDHAFNLAGEMFTFDSDMEWDINQPWYRDVRTVHGIPGGNYGYRNGSGKFPPYYLDSLPAVRDLGRGSPVGVEFYQHHVYPKAFHDALFEADWSRGRLLWTALRPTGATYAAVEEKTEFVHGEPLNITDLEVGPDGFMYFTIGGRLTEGGLYRVKYTGQVPMVKMSPVQAIVRQPQPLSSWGWAAIEQAKATMGASFASELEKLARDAGAAGVDRAQAVYILQRHGAPPSATLLRALLADKDATLRAAVVYVAGVQGEAGKAIAAAALKDADPMVKRRAAEALVRQGLSPDLPSFAPIADLYALLNAPDRFVRYSGRKALERTARDAWKDRVLAETNPLGAIEGLVALVETSTSDADLAPVADKLLAFLAKPSLSVDDRLRALRGLQLAGIAMHTVSPELKQRVHAVLVRQFPARDERLSRQLAVTLGWAGQPETIGKVLAAMPSGDTNQQLQLHYAYVLRTLRHGWTKEQKAQLIDWFSTATTWRGGASFPGFLNLLFDESLRSFDDAEKKLAYEKVPKFAPLSEAELAAAAQRAAQFRGNNSRPQSPANSRARGVLAISRDELYDELIFTPQRTAPSVAAGKAAYEQVCAACHRFGSIGTDIGPDLSAVASRFKKRDIVEAILWPSKAISDQYDVTMIETTDGNTLAGFVVSEEGGVLKMRTADTIGRAFEVEKSKVKKRTKSPVSMMPEGLVDELSQQQIQGLLAFLQAPPQ
jgi:putative heme-binding domain-containing protein